MLQPKFILFPEKLSRHFGIPSTSSSSFIQYSENETLQIPSLKLNSELDIATELASQLKWTKLKDENINIARLKGELFVEQSKHRLFPGNEQAVTSQSRVLLHWGSVNLQSLSTALQKMGINASVEKGMNDTESECTVRVLEPNKALIEINASSTVISASDEKLASLLFEAIDNSLDGI